MNLLKKIYKNIKSLEVNQKIIIGVVSFIFLNPLFFLFLTVYSYKEIKNKVVNGILTLVFGFLTLFSLLILIAGFSNPSSSENQQIKVEPTKQVEITPTVQSPTPYPTTEVTKDENSMLFKVTSVTDGDTVRIDYFGKSEPVRFIGVDTPEINSSSEPVMCYGKEAKKFVEDKLLNKMVKIEKEPKDNNRDKYDRLLRYIYLEDGTNFIEQEIKGGYALEYTYNKEYKYQQLFKEAQAYAKTNKLGLWADNTCKGSVYTGTYKDPNNKPTPSPKPTVTTSIDTNTNTNTQTNTYFVPQESNSGSWTCDCKKTCANMTCAEAQYQLSSCGCSARDADKDGAACDSQCQ